MALITKVCIKSKFDVDREIKVASVNEELVCLYDGNRMGFEIYSDAWPIIKKTIDDFFKNQESSDGV